ncbi:FAD-dependent oxidoreductase [Rhodococcus koreensis]|uniref:FAD-dependent oxidoreductase n=1 Tax=Rhodococcus koreensis TaxID=99653 RepID=UPI0036D9BB68
MAHNDYDSDVLVVGAGPMGATTALALASLGVRVHMITRYRWLADTPRAHITNQRALEVFRDLGIEDRMTLQGSDWRLMGDTLITTSLTGPEIARIRAWGTGDRRIGDYLAASPVGMLDIPQPKLENVLVSAAAERGATVGFNTEYLGLEQDADGVTAYLRDRISGVERPWRCRYLVGADGARSKVAEDIGIPIEGHSGRATTAYVQFTADLSRYVAHRPSILYWIMNPVGGFGEIGLGLLRAVHPWNEWIAGWGHDPANGEPDFSTDALRARIRALVGEPQLDVEIGRCSTWQVNQAYATRLSVGRVFCGGDAVHRHPPSGGLGSNTSVQDAHNLAWKLAHVVRGVADPALLDSYTAERVPVAQQIVERANTSRVEFQGIRDALAVYGGDPLRAATALMTDPGKDAVEARRALSLAVQVKDYEFNAHGIELNQRYRSGAVLPDPDVPPEEFARDPELYVQPSTRPGAKLPHAWVVGTDGTRVSTLDLVGSGRFAAVTGVAGSVWADAVEALGLDHLRSAVVGGPGAQDAYFEWAERREIDEAGVLLVRPDGYIAWRHGHVADVQEAVRLLGAALAAILGTTPSITGHPISGDAIQEERS